MIKYNTLREKVYKYLRNELTNGDVRSEPFIDQDKICAQLKISRMPLRDALIQLEAEGFVQIIPRRGVQVKRLSFKDVRDYYGVLSAIESYAIASGFHKIKPKHIKSMEDINQELQSRLYSNQFDAYYRLNIDFHNIFLSLSDNKLVENIVSPLKQRLYDFPRMQYDIEWELVNLSEHKRFIQSIKAGNRDGAVAIIRYEHWNFSLHKENIIRVYGFN